MPKFLAIATAVFLWSPVIIIVLMPASRAILIDALTSSLAGSIIPTAPKKTKCCSISSFSCGKFKMVRLAKPKTLKAWSDILYDKAKMFSLSVLVNFCIPLLVAM